jgi:peptidylprolyl isomerase
MFASQTNASVVARPGARAGSRRGPRAAARVTAASAPDTDRAPSTAFLLPTRRSALAGFALATASTLAPGVSPPPANAIGFTKELKKRDVGEEDYLETPGFEFRGAPHAGVKYYDLQKGQGDLLEPGKTAVLHYTCRYRGLTAVSSREARTLGGNRTIAEPLELKYGKLPSDYAKPLVRKTVVGIGAELRVDPELKELYVVNTVFAGPADRAGIKPQDSIVAIEGVSDLANVPIAEIGTLLAGDVGTDVALEVRFKADGPDATPTKLTLTREATAVVPKKRVADVEGGGGLFTGEGAPKPPPVVYVPEALRGMRVGGRRNIVVPADVGYADVGEGEIPPGATFKLEVELLEVRSAA